MNTYKVKIEYSGFVVFEVEAPGVNEAERKAFEQWFNDEYSESEGPGIIESHEGWDRICPAELVTGEKENEEDAIS